MASSVARICLNVLLWLISSRASLRSISGSATSWSKYEKEGKKCKENGKRGHRRWRGGKRMEEKGKECLQQIHTTPFPLNGKTNFLPRAHVPLGPCTRFSPVLTMGSGYEILWSEIKTPLPQTPKHVKRCFYPSYTRMHYDPHLSEDPFLTFSSKS